MTCFSPLILRTEETVESTIEPIVTEYSDVTIPALTMILIGVGALLLITAAVAVFLVIKNHGRNWGYMLLAGLASYMLNYILYTLIIYALQKIPGIREYLEARLSLFSLISLAASLILEFLCICLGLFYGFRLYEKRNLHADLTAVLAFGLGFFVGAILISKQLSNSIQYIMICAQINEMGFDPAVTSMVENGVSQEDAVNSILTLTKSWDFFFDSLSYLTRAIAETCTAVIVFGIYEQRFQKIHYATAFGVLVLAFIPGLLGIFMGDEQVGIRFIACILYAAIDVGVVLFLLKKYMGDYLDKWSVPAEKPVRKKDEPKKMPKITMPKD